MIDKIALLYIKDKKVLSTRSKGKDKFYFPGGKRDGNESDLETLRREIKEELCVNIVENTAKLYGVFEAQAHGKAEGVVVRMTCYTSEIKGDFAPDNEIEEIRWLSYKDKEGSSPVDQLIFDDLYLKGYID